MSPFFFSTILLIICAVNGAPFDYPDQMPLPGVVHFNALVGNLLGTAAAQGISIPILETPIQARIGQTIRGTFWNCLAIYHATASDFYTGKRPRIVVSDDIIAAHGTSETRALCAVYAFTNTIPYILPSLKQPSVAVLEEWGLEFLDGNIAGEINQDVLDCGIDGVVCLQDVAETNGFIPEIMGSIVAFEIIEYLGNDGWNQEGTLIKDGTSCTANCRRFGDTTNYSPKTNVKERWAPLIEDDGVGFFYHYDHVVPHIGLTADIRIMSRAELESKNAPDPHYNYKDASDEVVDRLKDLATNDTQKMLVEWFDDKVNIQNAVFGEMQELLGWSYEESVFYYVGYEASQYTAIVQSWLEKRRYDLVRPTTWIKNNKPNDIIETYGGPFQGVQNIASKDFESYFRVMPHSEYPSASGCICKSIQQYVDKYLQERHGITTSVSTDLIFAAGSSKIEPDLTPQNALKITMSSMTELSETCGESRLWGGMHFAESVPAAQQLCDGIGIKAFEYMEKLLNKAGL